MRVSSTAGCPTESAVRARIETLAKDRGAATVPAGEIVLDHPDRYRARIRVGSSAERTLLGDDCTSLADAAALVVVMSMYESPSSTPEEAPVPSAPSPPAPSVAPVAAPTEAPATGERVSRSPSSRAFRVFVRAAVLGEVASGLLPSAAAGGRALLGVGIGPVGLQVDGAVFASQSVSSPSGLEGHFGLAQVGARPCGHFAFDSIEITPCAGITLLRFSAAGRGTADDREESAWTAAPSATLGAAWFFSSAVGLRLALEGSVLVGRRRFVIENDGPLHRPASLVGSVALGPELHF